MKDRQRPADNGPPLEVDVGGYWERFARAFAAPLSANALLGSFVSNTAVTGAYAETWIRALCRNMLPTLRVSTGAVIRTTDSQPGTDLRKIPQIDLIIWDPTELPALFESDDFALVHTQAARGVIEVKRTITRAKLSALNNDLANQRKRLLSDYRRNTLGVVVAHPQPLFSQPLRPDWVAHSDPTGKPAVVRLLDAGKSIPDVHGVFALIYFLSHVARKVGR